MRVKNDTGSTKTWVGQQLTNGQEYDIGANELASWRSDSTVITDIGNLDLLVWDGVAYKATSSEAMAFFLGTLVEASVERQPPFSSKKIKVGGVLKSLYKRVHGVISGSIADSSTENIDFTVTYSHAKFTGAEIFNTDFEDTVNYKILDDASGTYSGTPNAVLNQFGFDVQMKSGDYKNTSDYDADLYSGMVIRCEYTNRSGAAKKVSSNLWLHEVV